MALDPAVAAAVGQLAEQGIDIFIPQGAEGMLSIEDGKLVIRTKLLSIEETIRCIACGYDGPDLDHVCAGPVACPN